jgi:hypothetical protein
MPGRRTTLALPILLVGPTILLLTAAEARAHRLVAEYTVLPGQKVQVSCRYKAIPKSIPAEEARVRVYRPNDEILAQGKTDEKGNFVFSYDYAEPLRVEVYHEGHRAEVAIDAPLLATNRNSKQEQNSSSPSEENFQNKQAQSSSSPSEENYQEWIKQILIGVGFLLALGAFILSLRNAKQVRELQRKLNGRGEKSTQ